MSFRGAVHLDIGMDTTSGVGLRLIWRMIRFPQLGIDGMLQFTLLQGKCSVQGRFFCLFEGAVQLLRREGTQMRPGSPYLAMEVSDQSDSRELTNARNGKGNKSAVVKNKHRSPLPLDLSSRTFVIQPLCLFHCPLQTKTVITYYSLVYIYICIYFRGPL